MLHVCHITTVHQPFDTRIFHKECKTLAKAGYDVTLIVPSYDDDKMTIDTDIIDGVKIVSLPKPKNRFFRMFCLTKKAYKIALKEKADIYHFHDPEFLAWAVKLRKETNAKIIYDIHENIPGQILTKSWIPRILRKPIAVIFNIYEKKISKQLDFIITVSPKVKKDFQRIVINKVEVVTNYPILEYFQQTKKNLQKKTYNRRKKRKMKLIYAGGLTRIRGIKEIIKSLEFIKDDVKLVLLGKFQEEGLREELKKLPEWKKVEFKGWLSQKEAYQEMGSSNIGLVCFLPKPNHINAVPNKIFEYMATGLPVIASNFPLWKEIIEGNKCGLTVNPKKPEEIAKAIEYLIAYPAETKEMGENGRKAVFEKYNWENESKKLLKIYEKLFKKEN